MSRFSGKKSAYPAVGSSRNIKIDSSLNSKNWVEFVLNLRNNESVGFGAAYESIKYEAKLEYWFPSPRPMTSKQYESWKNTLEYEMFKRQMGNIIEQVSKYDEACSRACETLLSSKFMSDEIRAMVVEHPLFYKVSSNVDPTEDEIEEFALGSFKTIPLVETPFSCS